jgi:hypothetical protein
MKNGNKSVELKSPELDKVLEQIAAASRVLNSAGNDVTQRIEALEESLIEAEPGLSVWAETLLSEDARHYGADGDVPLPVRRVVTLGFTKVRREKWGVAVREELTGRDGALVHEDIALLRKADRHLRILALPHLDGLARKILIALEEQVDGLRKARDAVASASEASREPNASNYSTAS